MLSKFEVDPSKIDGAMSVDKQKFHSHVISRMTILLLKGYFEREKIILHTKNLKHRKIILLINFIIDPTFFLIASCQILKYYAILINHESSFRRKNFPQLHRF